MRAAIKKVKKIAWQLKTESNKKEHSENISFFLKKKKISNLRLLQRKNSDTLGKVGMLSWIGEMGDSRVKVYECRSVKQAEFIEKLSNDPKVMKHLPRCYHREREFLVAEWVEGESVSWRQLTADKKLMDQMTDIHFAFHSQVIDYWPEEKCYFFDYLESRFNRFRNILPLDDFVSLVFKIMKEEHPEGDARLSHPDVTPVNVIIDKNGTLKAIDNDLITHTNYYLIDLFTLHRSMRDLPSNELINYLRSYCDNGGDLKSLVVNENFYNALWAYRMVGTCLQEGMLKKGLDLADDFVKGIATTHPVTAAVKKERLY